MASLFASVGSVAWTAVFFVLAISVIVAIHEYGHYIVGRWSGIKAEVFSIGFGKVIWSRTDRHGTRWQIAALPLGGYVRFLGDSDAASGKDPDAIDALAPEDRRHTMHGAPLWARASTVAAGPAFNFMLSIIVFAVALMLSGVAKEPYTIETIHETPVEADLRPGDEIVSIGGVTLPVEEGSGSFLSRVPEAPVVDWVVLRDGEEVTMPGPYPMPGRVARVQPRSSAEAAGLREGDVIVGVDGENIVTFGELRNAVATSEGRELTLTVWRDGETFETGLAPKRQDLPDGEGGFETRWLLGVEASLIAEFQTETPGLWTAVSTGATQSWRVVSGSVSAIAHIVRQDISAKNLNGPLMIAVNSGEVAESGFLDFLRWIAVLSTAVGFLNLLPIPVLDGGHLMFHAWEAITGHPPGDRALQVMMTIGLAMLGTLMVFALTNDIRALFFS